MGLDYHNTVVLSFQVPELASWLAIMPSDVVNCTIAKCSVRFRRAGKHSTCPGHSRCYVLGKYDPFHAPCYPCIDWLRGFANPLVNAADKLGCIASFKDWV